MIHHEKQPRPYIKNAIIFAIFVTTFFLIDWLTKHFIFDETNQYDWNINSDTVYANWKIIAFSSLAHDSTTFLSFLQVKMPGWAYDLMDMGMLVIFATSIFFSRHTLSAIGLSIILAGIMGNGYDMLRFDYVRDILIIPWVQHGKAGVFNFADIFIIVGAAVTFVSLVLQMIHDFKKDKSHSNKVA